MADVALEVDLQRACGRAGAGGAARGRQLADRGLQLAQRLLERVRRQPRAARALLEPAQRALEHGVAERAATHRLRVGIDRRGPQDVLDHPLHGAAGERLEPASRLALAVRERLEHLLGDRRAERVRGRLLGLRRLRAPQLVRRRRLRGRPGDLGEQPPAAAAPQLVGEQRPHVLDERRRLQRAALLVGGPEREEQRLLRARDARVEQGALARQRVLVAGQQEPGRGGQRPARVVVQERLGLRAPRQLAVLQAGDQHAPGSAARGCPAGPPAARRARPRRPARPRAPRPCASASTSSAALPVRSSGSRVSSLTAPRSAPAARASASASAPSTPAWRT